MEAQLQEVSRRVGHPGPMHRGPTHCSPEWMGGRVLPPGLPLTPQAGMETAAPGPIKR